jgi:transposase-like protein
VARKQAVVWLYFGCTLSLREFVEMFADRGVDVSYKTIRV